MKKINRVIAFVLTFAMACTMLPSVAFALTAGDTSAFALTNPSIEVGDSSVEVSFYGTNLDTYIGLEGIFSAVDTTGKLKLTNLVASYATDGLNSYADVISGKFVYSDTTLAGTQFAAEAPIITATYSVPEDIQPGEYEVNLTLTDSMDASFNQVTGVGYTSTITVKADEEPVEDSKFEIYYTLDSEVETADAGYWGYDVEEKTQVAATVWLRNKQETPVSVQAYDIYLTYDDEYLTYNGLEGMNGVVAYKTVAGANDADAVKAVPGDTVTHIQSIGNYPIDLQANGFGMLGIIVFDIAETAAYGEKLHITLTGGKGEDVTNISIANTNTVNDKGDANSYYPAVTQKVTAEDGTEKTYSGAEIVTEHTVTFDTDGGSEVAEQTVGHNLTATEPDEEPSKDNHTFAGWYTDKTYATEFDFDTLIKADTTIYAKWTKNTATVTWMDQDGTTQLDQDIDVEIGTALSTIAPADPTKAADKQFTYTFAGWADKAGQKTGTLTANLGTVTGDVTYYAAYAETLNKYTVTWYDDAGNVLREDKDQEYGVTPNYGSDPTKEQTDEFTYTFAGWSETKGGDALETLPTVDGDESYYAVFTPVTREYTVTYQVGTNGSFSDGAVTTEDVAYGKNPTKAPTPVPANGYEFTGWSDGTSVYTDLTNYKVTGTATLTAQYIAKEYTITLNPAGGSVSGLTVGDDGNYSMTYTITSTDALPAAIKTGYAFDGWKLETAVEGWEAKTYGANIAVTGKWGNVVLVAQWTEDAHEVKQSADVENGEVKPDVNSAKEGDEVTVTVTPAEGYEFGEDNTVTYTYMDGEEEKTEEITVTDEDGDGVYTGSFSMPDAPVEITATFTPIDYTITVTVTPDGYATVTPSKTPANINDEITLTASNIKDGYQLSGYTVTNATTNEAITETNGKFIMPASNVSVTAAFEGKSYTIVYNSNGGSGTMGNGAGTFGTETTLSTNAFTRDGYTFSGWSMDASGDVDYASVFNPDTYAESYNLYAVWTPNEYTVTLDYGYDNKTDGITVTYGGTYADLTDMDTNRDGYTFDGWFNDDGEQVTAETKVTATDDHTLTAKWTPEEYTVTLKANGGEFEDGTDSKVENVTYGEKYDLTEPGRDGYTFAGWVDSDNNPFTPGETVDFTDDLTLTAQWTANTYTITFKAMGGDLADGANWPDGMVAAYQLTYTIEDSITLPTLAKENYIFGGWLAEETEGHNWMGTMNGGEAYKDKYGNVTLTAQWEYGVTHKVEDYKYARDGFKLLLVAADCKDTQVYKFDGQTMYYTEDTNYLVEGSNATGVFYLLVENQYVSDAELNVAGEAKLTCETGTRATIDYNGKINGDDVLNIADANVVYQMVEKGGDYYSMDQINDYYRLAADMDKNPAEYRGSIADVNAIINIINGVSN